MRFRLTPHEGVFYDYFSKAADNLVVGADLLAQMVKNGADRQSVADQLSDIEHASDDITHQLYRQLNSTFVTPFDREDIYRLGSLLDDVMDYMEEAGSLIPLYGIAELPTEFGEVVDVLQRCAQTTAAAIPGLRQMKGLEEYWTEVNRLENEADKIRRKLLGRLFSGQYEALDVLKLKEVADQLEKAADAFEHVSNIVETIAVKES
ncbi:MAG: DUF47 domain-containing protein [Mycobacteriales bacterium]